VHTPLVQQLATIDLYLFSCALWNKSKNKKSIGARKHATRRAGKWPLVGPYSAGLTSWLTWAQVHCLRDTCARGGGDTTGGEKTKKDATVIPSSTARTAPSFTIIEGIPYDRQQPPDRHFEILRHAAPSTRIRCDLRFPPRSPTACFSYVGHTVAKGRAGDCPVRPERGSGEKQPSARVLRLLACLDGN